jgi:hypothetical protein
MRPPSVSRQCFLIASTTLVLVGVPAHAGQTNEYYGINCQLVPSASNDFTAEVMPDGFTLTPHQTPGHSLPYATFYCPVAFSPTVKPERTWMTGISSSIDARDIPNNAVLSPSCQVVMVTNNLGVWANNIPAVDTSQYYGIESAHLNCSIGNQQTRIHGYKLMVSYYEALPP